MPSDPVELTKQIKAASDIVAVVGGYLALKPAGPTFKALCPFHGDNRPSLDIDPRRQRYKCWACGKHGDVIQFIQEMEKVSFKEARLILANKAGIKLDENQSPQDQARVRLLGVMRWAQELHQECLLNDPIAEPARKYLGSRKLSGKSVRDFGLGFAPIDGNWLNQVSYRDRIPDDLLLEVGLTALRDQGQGYYPRFRDRVMFPIRDVQSRPVGFGGRIMPESPYASRGPKYYNSAETPLFSKSELLYGLDLARHAGAAVGYLAVVEGYTDVMMAHQCGVPQVVATMGTALNARHVAQLRRYAPKVVLVYDADAGGMTGVDRALEIFVSQDVELAVAVLPDGLDPCDLLSQSEGVEVFNKVLGSAVDALDFKMNRLLERDPNPSVEATRRIIDSVLGIMTGAPALKNQSSQVKQELIVTRLAQRLGLRHETVWARFGELTRDRKQNEKVAEERKSYAARRSTEPEEIGEPERPEPIESSTPRFGGEKQLLNFLLAFPQMIGSVQPIIALEQITHAGMRRVLRELYFIHAAGETPDMDILRERLHDRPDWYASAERCREVGLHTSEPDQDLARILGWFAKQTAQAEEKTLTAKLKGGSLDPDEATELLRKLQQKRTG